MKKTFFITTPIYYVNDVPHLGHAYTTVAADVLARYWRKKLGEENVYFSTGTDEHGQKVADAAKAQGIDVEEFVQKNSDAFRTVFEELTISANTFIRTTSEQHRGAVRIFMQKLKDADALEEGQYEGLYCSGCEDFKNEKDLEDGACPIHKTKPEPLKEKNWFFKLRNYKAKVRSLIESGEMAVEPLSRRHEVLAMLDDAPDFSVTRQRVAWGIPFMDDKSQIIYVWVEALQNYLSALGYPDGADFRRFWPADVHLMAKDIVKFHAIYWPAMLLAAGEKLPKKIFAHGFFTLNGQKMSKSLGNVIHPHELVERYGPDATRYLLLSQFPFGQDGDFTMGRLDDLYEAHLANSYGNLASRIGSLIEQSGGRVIQSGDSVLSIAVKKQLEPVDECYGRIDFNAALSAIHTALRYLNEEVTKREPWKREASDPERITELADMKDAFVCITEALAPLMPGIAARMLDHFTKGQITKLTPLFPRLPSEAKKPITRS